jgi:hypothetical protein
MKKTVGMIPLDRTADRGCRPVTGIQAGLVSVECGVPPRKAG